LSVMTIPLYCSHLTTTPDMGVPLGPASLGNYNAGGNEDPLA
jgi:hypothetical protein